MHRSEKPVGKCHGCGLNLRDSCGVFANPRETWERHKTCPGYKNEAMLTEYKLKLEKKKADARKEMRKFAALQRAAEPHHNGDRHVLIAVTK